MVLSLRWTKRPVLIVVFTMALTSQSFAFEVFDLVSGVIESPLYKGKDPIDKLRLAAEMLRNRNVKQSDMAFLLLDWGDQYIREPKEPIERLKRWPDLTNDEQLSNLKIPRDYLNRMLVAEYLVDQPAYLIAAPRRRLEIISKLAAQSLVDWSVSLDYARLYAGGIILGAGEYRYPGPLEALMALKRLKDEGLVSWQYRVPTEAILLAEALADNSTYRNGSPHDQLSILKDFLAQGLITSLTKKEMEKLPIWRMLGSDPSFIKADAATKRERLAELKDQGLISASTYNDLFNIFRPLSMVSPVETTPTPLPQQLTPSGK